MSNRTEAAYRAAAKRSENEERVTVNIAPDLLPLWRLTRGQFKGTPAQRLEAFQAYAEEHGTEIEYAIELEAVATLAREVKAFESAPEVVAFTDAAETDETGDDVSFDFGANVVQIRKATTPEAARAAYDAAAAYALTCEDGSPEETVAYRALVKASKALGKALERMAA